MNECQCLCFNHGVALRPIGVQYLLKTLQPLHSNISDWSMDQSHSLKNWCIMADFKLLTALIHKKKVRCDSNFQGLSYYVCYQIVCTFGLFSILIWGISAIIHQQLVAISPRHVRLIYSRQESLLLALPYDFPWFREEYKW